jgi:transcriptional regulator with XRE-family HTH domain
MRDTKQVRAWLRLQRGRRGEIARAIGVNAKTLERIVHDEGYFPRSDTLEKIDGYINASLDASGCREPAT